MILIRVLFLLISYISLSAASSDESAHCLGLSGAEYNKQFPTLKKNNKKKPTLASATAIHSVNWTKDWYIPRGFAQDTKQQLHDAQCKFRHDLEKQRKFAGYFTTARATKTFLAIAHELKADRPIFLYALASSHDLASCDTVPYAPDKDALFLGIKKKIIENIHQKYYPLLNRLLVKHISPHCTLTRLSVHDKAGPANKLASGLAATFFLVLHTNRVAFLSATSQGGRFVESSSLSDFESYIMKVIDRAHDNNTDLSSTEEKRYTAKLLKLIQQYDANNEEKGDNLQGYFGFFLRGEEEIAATYAVGQKFIESLCSEFLEERTIHSTARSLSDEIV